MIVFMEQKTHNKNNKNPSGKHLPEGALIGRSARVVVSMGMPSLLYRLFYRAHGVKAFNRSILAIAGFHPVRTTHFGGIGSKWAQVPAMLAKMRILGSKAL